VNDAAAKERSSSDRWRTLGPALSFLGILAVASAIALAVRFYLVEPEEVAAGCVAGGQGWQCWLRQWAVTGFLQNAYGIAAVILGILATAMRSRIVALAAVFAGVAGAVLYTFELSGLGILLGALVWVRRPPPKAVAQVQADQQA